MVEISVIIPAYNAIDYLNESIESIINQSFRDLEIICVDDGSTDNTLDVLNSYAKKDSRIQVYSQDNQGPGGASNTGLSKATGKYIYFMDADDILDLNALEEFRNIMEEKNLDLLIFKSIDYDDDTGSYYEEEYFTMPELHDFVQDSIFNWKDLGNLIFKINVTPWSKFYRHELIKRSGAQFPLHLIYHDNIFFWQIFFSSQRVYFYNKTLYIRRVHSSSCVHSNDERNIHTIKTNNLIVQTFIDYNHFEEFKEELYNRKIYLIRMRYDEINDEFKELFFTEMKRDYMKIIGHEKYDEFVSSLNPNNRYLFDNVIKSDSHTEYDLMNVISRLEISKNNILNEKNNLEKQNKLLQRKNKKLLKKNKKLMKLNEELLSSNSWKMTKPFRTVRNIFKK